MIKIIRNHWIVSFFVALFVTFTFVVPHLVTSNGRFSWLVVIACWSLGIMLIVKSIIGSVIWITSKWLIPSVQQYSSEKKEPGVAEEIRNDVEFCELWFESAVEGEPIAQDEIEAVKDLVKHIRYLLEENEQLRTAVEDYEERRQSASTESLRILSENERITKELKLSTEAHEHAERDSQRAQRTTQQLREELKQVKKERDYARLRAEEAWKELDGAETANEPLTSQLAEKDKVLEWYANETNWEEQDRGITVIPARLDSGKQARSILYQYAKAGGKHVEAGS